MRTKNNAYGHHSIGYFLHKKVEMKWIQLMLEFSKTIELDYRYPQSLVQDFHRCDALQFGLDNGVDIDDRIIRRYKFDTDYGKCVNMEFLRIMKCHYDFDLKKRWELFNSGPENEKYDLQSSIFNICYCIYKCCAIAAYEYGSTETTYFWKNWFDEVKHMHSYFDDFEWPQWL